MNKKAIIITISSIALIGAGIGLYFYFRKPTDDKGGDDKPDGLTEQQLKDLLKDITKQGGDLGNPDESEYSSKNKLVGDTVLKIGSEGRRVAMLQALLNHYKGASPKLVIDGVFGDKTRIALADAGFKSCYKAVNYVSPVKIDCEVTTAEFLALLKRTEKDKTFSQKYSPNVNKDMKAVYDKYSS